MKKIQLFCIIITCLLSSSKLFTQENVAFFHGIGSSGGLWTNGYNMIGKLKQTHNFTAISPSRPDVSFSTQADCVKSSLKLPITNYIAVGHSMGGLATRTYQKKYAPESKINRVITLGTPHQGAWIANSVYNGGLQEYLSWQTQAIRNPIFHVIAGWGWFSNAFLQSIDNVINYILINGIPSIFLQNSAMSDLRVESSGIQYLQATTENFNRVGIIGRETDMAHEFYRLGFTQITGNPSEGRYFQDGLYYTYAIVSIILEIYAEDLYNDGYISDAYSLWTYADYFWFSALDIAYSGYIWKIYNGSAYTDGVNLWVLYSDGVVPEYSQEYPNAINTPTYIAGTNHLLEGRSDRGKDAIINAFQKINFVNVVSPQPISASITPGSNQAPPGYAYTFSVNVSGGSGNYTIDWYYYYPSGGGGEAIASRSDSPDSFVPPGTGGWAFLKTGATVTFQPLFGNQLKAFIRDNSTGQTTESIIYW